MKEKATAAAEWLMKHTDLSVNNCSGDFDTEQKAIGQWYVRAMGDDEGEMLSHQDIFHCAVVHGYCPKGYFEWIEFFADVSTDGEFIVRDDVFYRRVHK